MFIDERVLSLDIMKTPNVLSLYVHIKNIRGNKGLEDVWHGIIRDFIPEPLITTVPELTKTTGISMQSVRTSLKKLVKAGLITTKTGRKFTEIIVNEVENV